MPRDFATSFSLVQGALTVAFDAGTPAAVAGVAVNAEAISATAVAAIAIFFN
jgi:hypothetical protein